jgi:hypothetical protein
MASPIRDLKETLRRLRNASPDVYDRFLSVFNDLVLEAYKDLSDAPSDQILVQQGRTQQLRALLRLFVEGGYPPEKAEPEPPTPL